MGLLLPPSRFSLRFGRLALLGGVVAISALPGISQGTKPPSAPNPKQTPTPPPNVPRPTFAPQTRRPPLLAPNEYLPVSRLRGGMKGYGLSVFHGNKIERFDVTILGVVKKANNGRDLILVKLGGPKMQRVTDVIAGMSGSPVYVDGKIVGAVAYGASFTRESMGYLTPIEDMLDAWDTNLPQSSEPPTTPPGMKPLLAKVTVSGVSGARMPRITAELAKLGIEARQGGGRAVAGLTGSPLTPGGAVAMSLATGDLDMTAVGTLTYRQGKQVVAFGHPFLGIGPIEAPMFSAYIHDIQPSFSESSKIGSPVKMVGSFSQDRPFSVGGRIGTIPHLIPLTVRVNDKSMGKQRVFRAQLLRHPQLTPTLAALAAGTAVAEVHGQPGDAMATITTEVTADGVGTLRHTTRVFDDAAMDEAAVADLRTLLGLMNGNPFYPVGVRAVNMTVNIEAGRKTAQVERIFLKQSRFAPGDTVEIGVVLKPFKQPSFTRTMTLQIPPSAPTGTLVLSVQGGAATGLSSLVSILSGARAPEYATATTVEQLLHKWEERDRGDALIARLTLPTGTISVRGERLEGLPTNIESAMRAGMNRTSGTRVDRDEVKVSNTTSYVVSGAQVLPIQIVRPGGPTSGSAPAPLPPSGAIAPSGGSTAPPPVTAPGASAFPDDDDRLTPLAAFDGQTPAPVRVPAAPPTGGTTSTPPSPTTPAPVTNVTPAAPPANPASTTPPVLVGRQPGVWRQMTPTDFRTGTLRGVAVSDLGEVTVAPRLTRVIETDEPFFWSVTPDGSGGAYAGSGDQGIVYHVAGDGKRTVFAQTGAIAIHALCRASDGSLYAGTSPSGRVLRITPDGKTSTFFQTQGKHVLALALSPDGGTLYAGVGGGSPIKARVYAVPVAAPTTARMVYEGDGESISALAVNPSGDVYAGTSPGGLIVKIPVAGGTATVLYDTPETAISGLVAQAGDVVYAATAPRGQVYRLAPGLTPRTIYERPTATSGSSASGLSALTRGKDGKLYAASGSSIIALAPGESGKSDTTQTFEAPSDIQILALTSGDDGTVWAATGSVGGVYALKPTGAAASGEYVSPVFDARAISNWGTVRWESDTPGTTLQTRSGNTSEPDGDWSAWSATYTAPDGQPVASPPARYVQYRALLSGGATLRGVELFYMPPNQAPQLALVAPRGGDVWRGTQTVRWSANDADRDTLSYEVSLSGDGGKTWQTAPRAGSPTQTAPTATPAPVTTTTQTTSVTATAPSAAVEAELAKHPEISAAMKAKILADTQKAAATTTTTTTVAPVSASSTSSTPATRDTSLPIDTSRLADGTYLVRVIASDRLANPVGALSTERVSGAFRVLNRAPELSLQAGVVGADRVVHVDGVAQHPTAWAVVRGVQFRVDKGDWSAALPTSGLFDSNRESFRCDTLPLAIGNHTIEVQAQDEAGNVTTKTVTVSVR